MNKSILEIVGYTAFAIICIIPFALFFRPLWMKEEALWIVFAIMGALLGGAWCKCRQRRKHRQKVQRWNTHSRSGYDRYTTGNLTER